MWRAAIASAIGRARPGDVVLRVLDVGLLQAGASMKGEFENRLRQVIEMHYGVNGSAPQNFAEIGRRWGLCRERIRQLHNEALALLRMPAISIQLRSICERQERGNYRKALRQNQNWQCKVRGRR